MQLASRLLSVVLALGLMALGVVGAAEATWQFTDRRPPLWVDYYVVTDQLQTLAWGHSYVMGAGGVLAAIGVLLLIVALRRGPRPLRLSTKGEGVRMEVPRPALRRMVANAVMSVDGVAGVKVKAGRRSVKIRAATVPGPPGSLKADVRTRVWEELDALDPRRRPRVVTRMKARSRKGA